MGYNVAEAEQIKRRVRTQLGKIEDAAHSLAEIVSDTQSPAFAGPLDAFRAEADRLIAVIDRRIDR